MMPIQELIKCLKCNIPNISEAKLDVYNVEIRYERSACTCSFVTHIGLLRSFYQTDLGGENEFDLIKATTPKSIMDNNIHWIQHYKQRR